MGEAARELEPAVSCIAAYLSPSTGVIDAAGLVAALDGHVTSLGGSVVLSTTATSLDRTADGLWRIGIESGGETASLTAKRVVNAAGHGATTARQFDHRYRLPRAAHVSSERPLFLAQQTVAVRPADLPDAARRLARRTSHAGRGGPRLNSVPTSNGLMTSTTVSMIRTVSAAPPSNAKFAAIGPACPMAL